MKMSIKSLSLLGLVLTGASIVTAAVIPSSEAKRSGNGVCLKPDGSGSNADDLNPAAVTCTNIGAGQECDVTLTGTAVSAADTNTQSTTLSAAGGVDGTGCQA